MRLSGSAAGRLARVAAEQGCASPGQVLAPPLHPASTRWCRRKAGLLAELAALPKAEMDLAAVHARVGALVADVRAMLQRWVLPGALRTPAASLRASWLDACANPAVGYNPTAVCGLRGNVCGALGFQRSQGSMVLSDFPCARAVHVCSTILLLCRLSADQQQGRLAAGGKPVPLTATAQRACLCAALLEEDASILARFKDDEQHRPGHLFVNLFMALWIGAMAAGGQPASLASGKERRVPPLQLPHWHAGLPDTS